MIERAIESWLTNANERNFQAPLCQVLLHQGHRVVYVSPHRPLEQGKDIISVGQDGEVHAYQLKTGRIDIGVWRTIRGEIAELVELPVVHPSVDPSRLHRAYLVTNDDVTDEVRHQIDLINRDNQAKSRNYAPLEIVNRDTLLIWFLDAQTTFLPHSLDEFDLFLRVRLADGRDFFPVEAFQEYLERVVLPDDAKGPANRASAVLASAISTAHLLDAFQQRDNHFAMFQAWATLLAAIVRYGWVDADDSAPMAAARELVFDEILRVLNSLRDEALDREVWIHGEGMGDGDLIHSARVTMVLGLISALETSGRANCIGIGRLQDSLKCVCDRVAQMWFWGESAFPYYLAVIHFLETHGQAEEATALLMQVFERLLDADTPGQPLALPNPYYGPSDVLLKVFNLESGADKMSQAGGSSFCLLAVIEMLVRRGLRAPVQRHWKRVSKIALREFEPKETRDLLLPRARSGTNNTAFLPPRASWSEMVAACANLKKAPPELMAHREALSFFVLAHPHRLTPTVCRILDARS